MRPGISEHHGGTRLSSKLWLMIGVIGMAAGVVHAADIHWVGYQYGSGAGGWRNSASWFHGDQWLNYLVPGPGDHAIFDTTFDLQANGMPRQIYFGNYTVAADPPSVPAPFTVPGGDASVKKFTIREGEFEFRFESSIGTPQGSLTASERFDIGIAAPGGTRDVAASLTITGGLLTQSEVQNWDGVVLGQGWRSTGTLVVDGPNARVDVSRDMWLGNGGGTGIVEARNGGAINARSIGNGLYSGPQGQLSTGHVLASGPGSFIGQCGGINHGTLTIQNGAQISSLWYNGDQGFAFLGVSDDSAGSALIEGAGSNWVDIARLTVGGVYHSDTSGRGELTVRDQGLVESSWLVVGNRSRSSGSVLIEGEGSGIKTSVALLGDDGLGIVRVTGGAALLVSGGARIGNTENGQGDVEVSFNGRLESSGELSIGAGGLGSLTILSGGYVEAVSGSIGQIAGGVGTAIVGDDAYLIFTDRLSIAGAPWPGEGGDGLLFVGTGAWAEVGQTLEIWDKGIVTVMQGGSLMVGNSAPRPGQRLDGAPGALWVDARGVLAGSGIVSAVVGISDGTLSPGHDSGTATGSLFVDGDVHVSQFGSVIMDITGSDEGAFDRVVASGAASVDGSLSLRFLNGYQPTETASFEIFTANGGVSGEFQNITISGVDPTRVKVWKLGNGIFVTVSPTGECLGDADGNRIVNFDDITFVLANYGASGAASQPGDVDGSGDVDMVDITMVLATYGQECV